ncbi:MAG: methionyl-tRNA formyltransferase [Solirubrobacteraceae bacterium]|nr:methionyl-tRNA formyltransferase [Solirubrobacteraceae bacterium]
MRTVFLGTSAFAAAVLERLGESEHRPALVVTRPDRPRGRGRRVEPPPVAVTARALGLEVDQPEDLNSPGARARIQAAEPDVVCVCAFGALIKEPLLSDHEMLNVHPSLLPRWRGAAPIERAIQAGDEETGVSIMKVTAGLDSGPVCLQATEPIRPDDTYGTLATRLETVGAELLLRALDVRPDCREQDDSLATYAEKVAPADRRLDPSLPAVALERTVRALAPHIGAFVELEGGERLRVNSAAVDSQARPTPGRLTADGERLLLGCAEGALELLSVQPPGGRAMDAAAYLRGHPLTSS